MDNCNNWFNSTGRVNVDRKFTVYRTKQTHVIPLFLLAADTTPAAAATLAQHLFTRFAARLINSRFKKKLPQIPQPKSKRQDTHSSKWNILVSTMANKHHSIQRNNSSEDIKEDSNSTTDCDSKVQPQILLKYIYISMGIAVKLANSSSFTKALLFNALALHYSLDF